MAKAIKGREHDSTAAMANAYLGTPGCGDAIERVFGDKGGKTETEVKVQGPVQSPLFCLPHFDYTIDLRCIRGVTGVFSQPDINGWSSADIKEYMLYTFEVDLVHQARPLVFGRTDRQDSELPVKGMTQVHEARSALIQAWADYTKEHG